MHSYIAAVHVNTEVCPALERRLDFEWYMYIYFSAVEFLKTNAHALVAF